MVALELTVIIKFRGVVWGSDRGCVEMDAEEIGWLSSRKPYGNMGGNGNKE